MLISGSTGQQAEVSLPEVPNKSVIVDGHDTGIRFDFLCGLRIRFPQDGGPWRLAFSDMDTGTILFDADVQNDNLVQSVKRYYVRFSIAITSHTEGWTWEHALDFSCGPVAVIMPVPTIGDTFAWLPYIEKFRRKHRLQEIIAVVGKKFLPLFQEKYQGIWFFDNVEDALALKPYAAYYPGLWWKGNREYQPCDHRLVGLSQTVGHILGVDPAPVPPRLDLSAPRKIQEPYVCIAVQSTTMSKNWSAPEGWIRVVQFLKSAGYRVLCCDKDRISWQGIVTNYIPWGCEDFTGALPLQERIDLIKDADFFVGLASGLSWMAWACGIPVVMISGFSHPITEFDNPFRVINYNACNSCWNDVQFDFDHHDWLWCPRHKDTPRMHECMRMISAHQVIETIKRIPVFKERTESNA